MPNDCDAMPNITTCSKCSRLYEAGSEETANEPDRLCPWCVGPEAVARYKTGRFKPDPRDEAEPWDEDEREDEERGSRCSPACGWCGACS